MAAGKLLARTGTHLLDEGARKYAEHVGGLLYLEATTFPDNAFAAGVPS